MITEADLLRRSETGADSAISGWRALLMGPERLAERYVRSHKHKVEEVIPSRPGAIIDGLINNARLSHTSTQRSL